MASVIKLKNGSGAPATGDLVQGEPAFDLTNKRLYTENASGAIIEVGTNPSVLTTTTGTFSGNVGVGGAPEATWAATAKVLELSGATNDYIGLNSGSQAFIYQNAYFDGDNKYKNTGAASAYGQLSGAHVWYTAPSGTADASAVLTERMRLELGGNLLPGTDNTQTNGGASKRWSVVYAGTGAINTSDAREKTAVVALTSDEIEASKQLGKEIGIFQWLSSVEKKGAGARRHVGMTVQRAIEIMVACSLNPMSYGFICYDEWLDEFVEHEAIQAVSAVAAVDATETEPAVAAVLAVEAVDAWTEQIGWSGNRYGFRPDQLNSFIAAGFNARLTALEAL
jgi:hypothetical protein